MWLAYWTVREQLSKWISENWIFFFQSTTVEEIEIFVIKENYYKAAVTSANW